MAENNHNLDGIQAPVLEETTYDPSRSVKRSLEGIEAPVLEDTAYTPEKKTSGLGDVAAPVLSDTYTPGAAPQQFNPQAAQPQFQQYGQNPQMAQPQFQQYGQNPQAAQPQFQQYGQNPQMAQPQFQQYGQNPQAAQPQFQQYCQNPQMAQPQFQQYGQNPQAAQPQFQQYGQNPQAQQSRNLDDVQKPVLDDEPAVQQRYVPKFTDPDLEAAKKTAVDRAIKSSLNSVPESFDEEKSRETYREFMREKEADLAKKGGIQVIFIMIAGMISGLLTLLYSFGGLKEETPGIIDTFNMVYMILGIIFIGGAAAMLVKSNTTRKLAANIFTIGTVLHVIPGVFVMFAKESRTSAIVLYLAVLIINIVICFTYGSSESIKKHYNGHGNETYY